MSEYEFMAKQGEAIQQLKRALNELATKYQSSLEERARGLILENKLMNERDAWRKVAEELELALQNCSPMCRYLSQEWGKWTALRHQALAAYEKLKGQ
jgi:hypothetical protein